MHNIVMFPGDASLQEELVRVKYELARIALLSLEDKSADAYRSMERALEAQIAERANGVSAEQVRRVSVRAEPARQHRHLRLVYSEA
jgi:hypothetical protein